MCWKIWIGRRSSQPPQANTTKNYNSFWSSPRRHMQGIFPKKLPTILSFLFCLSVRIFYKAYAFSNCLKKTQDYRKQSERKITRKHNWSLINNMNFRMSAMHYCLIIWVVIGEKKLLFNRHIVISPLKKN